MKTKITKLNFKSKAIVELNDSNLNNIKGGTLSVIIESYIRAKTYGTWIDHGPI